MHLSCEKLSSKGRYFCVREFLPVLPPLLSPVREDDSRTVVSVKLFSVAARRVAKTYFDVLAWIKERGIQVSHRKYLPAWTIVVGLRVPLAALLRKSGFLRGDQGTCKFTRRLCSEFTLKTGGFRLGQPRSMLPPLLGSVRKNDSRAIVAMELLSVAAGLIAGPHLDVLARMKKRRIFVFHWQTRSESAHALDQRRDP